MSKEGKFLIYCIEIYRMSKNMTGKQVMDLFKRFRVTDYVMSYYESLHTTGSQYTIDDIDLFIESRQTV